LVCNYIHDITSLLMTLNFHSFLTSLVPGEYQGFQSAPSPHWSVAIALFQGCRRPSVRKNYYDMASKVELEYIVFLMIALAHLLQCLSHYLPLFINHSYSLTIHNSFTEIHLFRDLFLPQDCRYRLLSGPFLLSKLVFICIAILLIFLYRAAD